MTVFLVGAGPGDPELLTVRGWRLLARADVVIYDALSAPELLEIAPPWAERISVGKRRGFGATQPEINELLVVKAAEYETVVRLKGGDPFLFGRGGEEIEALRDAGVAYEVVAGVSSALAAPLAAGIPVTHRGVSASVTVVTGHRAGSDPLGLTNWEALAQVGGTIVVLMGVEHRGAIAARLHAAGMPATTPVATITWATTDRQVVTRCLLSELARAGVESPCTIVIGEAAGLDLSDAALVAEVQTL
jgi:uroporphyrin-III C-methyltransferase